MPDSMEREMQISQREAGNTMVIELKGRSTSNETPGRLKDKVASLVFEGHTRLVLDVGGLDYLDSSGLGEVVSSYAHASSKGATLKLANPTGRIQDMLVMTKLLTVFDSYPTVDEAVASFK